MVLGLSLTLAWLVGCGQKQTVVESSPEQVKQKFPAPPGAKPNKRGK